MRQQNRVSRTIHGLLPYNSGHKKRCLVGQEHPPSTYAHDAKWCILGIWLSTMIYQFYEAAKAGREEMVALPKWIHLWLRSVDMHRLCLLFVSSPKFWAWIQPRINF